MIFLLHHTRHSAEEQQALRQWFRDNGFVYSALSGPTLVDPVRSTLTVNRRVPMLGQEDRDFPEFVADDDAEPITEEEVAPLLVTPLTWMLTMTGAWPMGEISQVAAERAGRTGPFVPGPAEVSSTR